MFDLTVQHKFDLYCPVSTCWWYNMILSFRNTINSLSLISLFKHPQTGLNVENNQYWPCQRVCLDDMSNI